MLMLSILPALSLISAAAAFAFAAYIVRITVDRSHSLQYAVAYCHRNRHHS